MPYTAKHQIAPAPYPVEGAGSAHFSNKQMYLTMFAIPLLVNFGLGLSLTWYPVMFGLFLLPSFIAFHLISSLTLPPLKPQTGLPKRPIEDYMTIKGSDLLRYSGNRKIPMETFFESYFDQKIDLKGDMLETLEARHDWASFNFTVSQATFFFSQWVPETLWHSRKQDEDQVRDHYDRGDDFYNWFLGPMMIYTSGMMSKRNERETLEEMQERKLETVCKKIQLKPGDRMLDIGCGWGTLSVHAAKKGARVTGVTLGRNQHEWGMGKAREAKVEDNVEILCMDYRDIPKQKFDKITCLEMAEHVGVLRFSTFLRQVKDMLEDDGLFFLQIAGLRRAWQYEDLQWGLFMAKYVFPGADASMPLNWVVEELERNGFEVESTETLGVHYSTTIFRWYENWMNNKEKVIEKYGVRWFRIWEFFLAYSTIIARQGSATVYQLVCHKNLNGFDRSIFIENRLKVVS
ncbi:S-adenosyl-L-methionine-dependent methyltransferase [Gorgonomyces haynaldii]|nr:S-adenosyl-L-methionine-dependent methyltransferase [Gorgonomyces haynaldii]